MPELTTECEILNEWRKKAAILLDSHEAIPSAEKREAILHDLMLYTRAAMRDARREALRGN